MTKSIAIESGAAPVAGATEDNDVQGHIWMFALAMLGGAVVGGFAGYGGYSAYEDFVEGQPAYKNPKGGNSNP